jgi:hypothetical protein
MYARQYTSSSPCLSVFFFFFFPPPIYGNPMNRRSGVSWLLFICARNPFPLSPPLPEKIFSPSLSSIGRRKQQQQQQPKNDFLISNKMEGENHPPEGPARKNL